MRTMVIGCLSFPRKVITDEDGERALLALRESMPSKRQTEYNQRDLDKRRRKKIENSS